MGTSSLGTLQIDLQALTSQFNAELQKSAGEVQKFSAKVGKDMQTLGKGLTAGLTVPILAAGAAALLAANKLEEADRKIAVGTGAAGAKLTDLQRIMREVAKESPEAFDTISGAVATYNTAIGAAGDELAGLVDITLDSSRLMGEDAAANAVKAGRAFKQFGVDAGSAREVMAAVYQLAQDNVTTIGDILYNVAEAGPILATANLSMIESADLIARLEGQGIKATGVMTGFARTFGTLAKAGIPAEQGLNAITDAIVNARSEEEGLALAVEFFGQRSAPKLYEALRSGQISFRDLGKSIHTTADEVSQFASDNEDDGEAIKRAWNQIMIAIEPFGKVLSSAIIAAVPAVTWMADKVGALGERFDKLSPAMRTAIVTGAALAAAAGPVLVVAGKAVSSAGDLAVVLGKTTGAALRLGLALAGPVAIGVAALSAAFLGFEGGSFLYDEFTSVQEIGARTINALEVGWEDFKLATSSAAAWMEKVFDDASSNVLKGFSTGTGWLKSLTDEVEKVAGTTEAGNFIRALDSTAKAIALVDEMTSDAQQKFVEDLREAEAKNRAGREKSDAVLAVTLAEIEAERKRREETGDPRGGASGMGARFAEQVRGDAAVVMDVLRSMGDAWGDLSATIVGAEEAAGDAGDTMKSVGDATEDSAERGRAAMAELATVTGLTMADIREAMRKHKEELAKANSDVADDAETLFRKDLVNAVNGWSRDTSKEFASMVLRSKVSFDELLQSWTETMAAMAFQRYIFDGLFGAFGDLIGPTDPTVGGSLTDPNLIGPIDPGYHGRIRSFAHGGTERGTVTRHTATFSSGRAMGVTSEGDREELGWLPITRVGEEMAIRAVTGGESGAQINIYDQRQGGAPIEVNRSTTPDGREQIDVLVRESVTRQIAQGKLDGALMSNFRGIRRTGSRR